MRTITIVAARKIAVPTKTLEVCQKFFYRQSQKLLVILFIGLSGFPVFCSSSVFVVDPEKLNQSLVATRAFIAQAPDEFKAQSPVEFSGCSVMNIAASLARREAGRFLTLFALGTKPESNSFFGKGSLSVGFRFVNSFGHSLALVYQAI